MSASFPQVAFWVIFPLAVLIVLSGWVMILISAARKLRATKQNRQGEAVQRPATSDPFLHQPVWLVEDMDLREGVDPLPLQ